MHTLECITVMAMGFIIRSIHFQTLMVAIATALAAMAPLLVNEFFYYTDDSQTGAIPMFSEIARILSLGEFPLASDHSWFAGAILGEYQGGVLNPFNLIFIAISRLFDNLTLAGAFIAIAHYMIYSAGTHVLCIRLGFSRGAAAVGAVTTVSSTWLLYWGAGNWLAALISLSWLPWSFVALLVVARDPRWIPVGGLVTALPFLSGWPFTNLCLFLLLGVALVATAVAGHPLHRLATVAVTALLGAGLALPAMLPTSAFMAETQREPGSASWNLAVAAWRCGLEGLLSFGFPSFAMAWNAWGEIAVVHTPMFYLAWFCPLVLVHADWRRLSSSWQGIALLAATVLLGLLCMTPPYWHIRFTFRFLPYFHFALALLTAWALNIGAGQWWKPGRSVVVVGLPFLLALFNAPLAADRHFFFLGVIIVLTVLVILAQRTTLPVHFFLLSGQLVVFLLMIKLYPVNASTAPFPTPAERPTPVESNRLELALYSKAGFGMAERSYWQRMPLANRGLLEGRTTINGYSAIMPSGLKDMFCFNIRGAICCDLTEKLFKSDAKTGLILIDLLRIERVTADQHDFAEDFRRLAGSRWRIDVADSSVTSFVRTTPLTDRAGSAAWFSSDGIGLALLEKTTRREIFDLTTPVGFAGGEIVFARPWYPGVNARLNGQVVPMEAYRRLLPAVTLPAGASGRLVVEYWPAGLTEGLICAAV